MILGVSGRAGDIPESRLARRLGDADAGGAAIHVIGEIDAFGVAGQGLDPARLGLREQGIVDKIVFLKNGRHGIGAAAKADGVDRQHRDMRIDIIALVATQLEFALQGLAQHHPERITGGDAVTRRHHELVGKGVLGPAVIIAHAAMVRAGQMRRHIEGRIGQRPAKMSGLGIVPQKGQGHAGHEPDIFHPRAVVWAHCNRRYHFYPPALGAAASCGGMGPPKRCLLSRFFAAPGSILLWFLPRNIAGWNSKARWAGSRACSALAARPAIL